MTNSTVKKQNLVFWAALILAGMLSFLVHGFAMCPYEMSGDALVPVGEYAQSQVLEREEGRRCVLFLVQQEGQTRFLYYKAHPLTGRWALKKDMEVQPGETYAFSLAQQDFLMRVTITDGAFADVTGLVQGRGNDTAQFIPIFIYLGIGLAAGFVSAYLYGKKWGKA